MKSNISNRHRGDLGGRLNHVGAPARVTVSLSRESARSPTAQHLTWMLLNLLTRQTEEVGEIVIDVPAGVPCAGPLSPLVPHAGDLAAALRAGVGLINPGTLNPRPARSTVSVRVGPGPLGTADFSLSTSAAGWSGYVGRRPADVLGEDGNPVGAYVAAALCAGEVFKFVRGVRPENGSFADRLWLNAYDFTVSESYEETPPLPREIRLRPTVLAGVGAVANGFLHTLYPIAGLTGEMTAIDGDPQGVTDTNLNRYSLFGLPHVEAFHFKASTAAAMFEGRGLVVRPYDGSWQEWREENPDAPLDVVVSAVDKNVARHAVQDALPQLILGASTKDLRAQINLYDIFGGGPCLRCRNRLEQATPDDIIIERLRAMPPDERAAEAARHGVRAEDLEDYLSNPRANCGKVSGATLQKFAGASGEGEWSVGFVSLLAGVLLAAEYLKLHDEGLSPALDAERNMMRFQFWRPAEGCVNRVVQTPPEASCACQLPFFRKVVERLHGARL